ncbi:hypothetical protein [Pseudomonas putida]|uniref:hypothetical protein n=1 Tax=Pseudomonas putida TaxID=303 RepID=UPI002B24A411|nr:hypothetical protein [Pseudomonas putida]
MTTITWDLKALSADTLVSDSAAMVKTGFFTERGWSLKTKLRVPEKHVTYERSPIIAVGASGSVFVGNMIADYLLDHNLKEGTRPSTPLEAKDLLAHTTAVLANHSQDASLLILTETHCWRLKAVPGKPVDIADVTSTPTAIGAGALYAQPCLDVGQSGVESIIEAALHPASETNFHIDYVTRGTPVIKRAWQSYTTLRDPLRLNRLTTRCIAVIGGSLTAAGGVALQAGGFTGISEMLWVALTMVGLVATVSSVLPSLRDARGLVYHLIPIVTMVLLLSWDESERFLKAYSLPPLFLLYITAVLGLGAVRATWPCVRLPLIAVHVGAGLSLACLLAAVTLFSQAPYDWPLFFAGTVGVGVGYAATFWTVNQMVQRYSRNRVIIERY